MQLEKRLLTENGNGYRSNVSRYKRAWSWDSKGARAISPIAKGTLFRMGHLDQMMDELKKKSQQDSGATL